MRHRGFCSLAAILPILFCIACDEGHATGPQVFGVGPSPSMNVMATVQPPIPTLMPIFGFGCPFRQPFTSSFSVMLQEPGGTDLILDRATFHVLDRSNTSSEPIVFSRPNLDGLFPTTHIPGRTVGTFPFTLQFGCGITTPQTLIVDLILIGPFSLPQAITMRAEMR
jgi:hypothetical protein